MDLLFFVGRGEGGCSPFQFVCTALCFQFGRKFGLVSCLSKPFYAERLHSVFPLG